MLGDFVLEVIGTPIMQEVSMMERAASTGFDDSATTDSVADACYCPASHECCACACFYGAFAMDRATMTMAYEYDGFHLRFPFFS